MSDRGLAGLEAEIIALTPGDIATCMRLYDTLSGYATGAFADVIDAQIKDIVRRIMTRKQEQLSTLTVHLNALKQ